MTINTIVFAGCGALGSLIASHLNCDPSIEYVLIDDDIVEQQNIGTSVYETIQIGIPKVQALGTLLYRRNRRKCQVIRETITRLPVKGGPYGGDVLVVDTFDNPRARSLTRYACPNIIHCGVSPDFTGSILWNELYPVLDIEFERGANPVCTHAIGAQIIRLTAVHSSNIIETYLQTGQKLNRGVTLR